MSIVDPVGDMITRISNGQMRLLNKVEIPASRFREKILDILVKEQNLEITDVNTGNTEPFDIIVIKEQILKLVFDSQLEIYLVRFLKNGAHIAQW